ncbi:MAG: hypothetical protein QNJ46_17850 [Leptolyngbyaceae cyanobacterium MO_188.B28]|nr:hypothetical protein [Leptolyngbyaceae cyanobacterium MO_188.B28]
MLPELPDFSLSYEQQFDLQKYKQLIKDISRPDLEELMIQVMRLQMAHENLAKGMIKNCVSTNH